MLKKTSRALLHRSCDWIRMHWDAENLDVPDDLLYQWLYHPGNEENDPQGFYLAVFSFGYFQHDLIASGAAESGIKRSVPSALLFRSFELWQMKLALVEVHRVTDVRIRPMPLFNFPDDEHIEYCRVQASV
jgi:hypothetical protein